MDQERNDDARKAHWRRKMANKALAMADSDLLAMGTLVYLPGEADHDRKVFLQKGVKERNLLCVERKRAIGEQHRGAKKTTVIADLADALMGHDWPISVVWADLCCTLMGRTANAICDAALLSRGVSPATVLMLNVMRGRDSGVPDHAKDMVEWGWLSPNFASNRAAILFAERLRRAAIMTVESGLLSERESIDYWTIEARKMQPYATTYKNKHKGVVISMDSICFKAGVLFGSQYNTRRELVECGLLSKRVSSQVAAVRAVMTMRRTGAL
jgi:hypothetical protein